MCRGLFYFYCTEWTFHIFRKSQSMGAILAVNVRFNLFMYNEDFKVLTLPVRTCLTL